MADFIEGAVYYPDDLPCPQVETDLVPRERRYISDITDVRNMRMFQQEFQATRNKISFVFTEEEAREFRDWYENTLIYGGAWFYADWPILHKDKKISYRFVGQPKYQWLYGANPGAMGRSRAGNTVGVAPDAVTMYKVTATVELYEGRKVGKTLNVYTSKIYPLYTYDSIIRRGYTIRAMPNTNAEDSALRRGYTITSGSMRQWIYSSYTMQDESVKRQGYVITSGSMRQWIYSSYTMQDEAVEREGYTIVSGSMRQQGIIYYDYFHENEVKRSGFTIISGEIT